MSPSGTAYETVGYLSFGDSDDWMLKKANIIAFGPEVGPNASGFWPDKSIMKGVIERNFPRTSYTVIKGGCEVVPKSAQNGSVILRNAGLDDCAQFSLGIGDTDLDDTSFRKVDVDAITKRGEKTVSIANAGIDKLICAKESGISVCICYPNEKQPGQGTWHGSEHKLCNYLITQEAAGSRRTSMFLATGNKGTVPAPTTRAKPHAFRKLRTGSTYKPLNKLNIKKPKLVSLKTKHHKHQGPLV